MNTISYLDIDNLVYERYPWKNEEINPIVFLLVHCHTKFQQENEKSYQINSEQIEQNVGCRKNVAINLCPFIS